MEKLFQYNWQVRDDWFRWCENIPEEELMKKRIGGVGSILYTLFHIVEVEGSWIQFLKTRQFPGEPPFEDYASLDKVKNLSKQYRQEVEPVIMAWTNDMELRTITITTSEGQSSTLRHGEIMRHMIAHEIHHIGQLSVWAREIGKEPVTANLILRGLF